MPLDKQVKAHLMKLQDEAQEVLMELSDIFPPDYRFTLIARHHENIEGTNIVLTNDYLPDAITALQRDADRMEGADQPNVDEGSEEGYDDGEPA